jgi:hypothetical protein
MLSENRYGRRTYPERDTQSHGFPRKSEIVAAARDREWAICDVCKYIFVWCKECIIIVFVKHLKSQQENIWGRFKSKTKDFPWVLYPF